MATRLEENKLKQTFSDQQRNFHFDYYTFVYRPVFVVYLTNCNYTKHNSHKQVFFATSKESCLVSLLLRFLNIDITLWCFKAEQIIFYV